MRSHGLGYVYYRESFARKILGSRPVVCGTTPGFELHTLVCRRDVLSALWALKTFFHHGAVRPGLVVYDDGSLRASDLDVFSRHFVNGRIVGRRAFDADMQGFLKHHATSRRFAGMASFHCAMKLFGPMCHASSRRVLYLDSDVLFFRRPERLLTLVEADKPCYLGDYQDAYAHPVEVLRTLVGMGPAPAVNAGLYFRDTSRVEADLDLVETYFERVSAREDRPRDVNRHEQTLAALLLSRAGAERLDEDYGISRAPVTDRTVAHHFVDDGSRPAFYVTGLARLRASRFLEEQAAREGTFPVPAEAGRGRAAAAGRETSEGR